MRNVRRGNKKKNKNPGAQTEELLECDENKQNSRNHKSALLTLTSRHRARAEEIIDNLKV